MKHSDARYPDEIAEDIARSQTLPATEELIARRSAAACSPPYFPGMDCQCSARSEAECGCPGADWTPTQLRNLRRENAEMRAIIYEVSTGGYTPMAAHEWLKSHPENAGGMARELAAQDSDNSNDING